MPEIGEVARIVHYIQKNLVGKKLAVVKAQHDENVFGKVGTSAAEFEKALTGKKVVDAKQQGKYFWLVMSSPPHPLFHFGMAGWWKIRNLETAYYRPSKPQEDIWPPKYWKFTLETASDNPQQPKSEHAFVDFRRFARVRLVDCAAEDLRNVSPLKENGPDPVIDRDILTEEWLVQKLQSKHVPVKALLLDQANISGIGNWVGDELLFDAKIHPEQYSNTLTPAQMKQLHKSIHYVCSTSVELLAESDKFPEHWLFKHRWGKGKKDDPQCLPSGEKIKFITVGGRTSAIVPSVQKKTGAVAGDVGSDEDEEAEKPKKTKRKSPVKEADDNEEKVESDKKPRKTPKTKKAAMKEEEPKGDDADQPNSTNLPSRTKSAFSEKSKGEVKTEAKTTKDAEGGETCSQV
ncbi:MAG: hypothetical protein L6R41_000574 [Letrouitia leprolyta]|nr:MAG: hypothetical protein L6R41_000574 [Letrouitia leprolyta]